MLTTSYLLLFNFFTDSAIQPWDLGWKRKLPAARRWRGIPCRRLFGICRDPMEHPNSRPKPQSINHIEPHSGIPRLGLLYAAYACDAAPLSTSGTSSFCALRLHEPNSCTILELAKPSVVDLNGAKEVWLYSSHLYCVGVCGYSRYIGCMPHQSNLSPLQAQRERWLTYSKIPLSYPVPVTSVFKSYQSCTPAIISCKSQFSELQYHGSGCLRQGSNQANDHIFFSRGRALFRSI